MNALIGEFVMRVGVPCVQGSFGEVKWFHRKRVMLIPLVVCLLPPVKRVPGRYLLWNLYGFIYLSVQTLRKWPKEQKLSDAKNSREL